MSALPSKADMRWPLAMALQWLGAARSLGASVLPSFLVWETAG